MKSSVQLRSFRKGSRGQVHYRPDLETLEARQPVSDTLLGGLMTLSILEPGLTPLDRGTPNDFLPCIQRRSSSVDFSASETEFWQSMTGPIRGRDACDQPQCQDKETARGALGNSAFLLLGNDAHSAGAWTVGPAPWSCRSTPATTANSPMGSEVNTDLKFTTQSSMRAPAIENSAGVPQLTQPFLKGVFEQARDGAPRATAAALGASSGAGLTSGGMALPSTSPEHESISGARLRFEANKGQFDAQVHFLTRGPAYTLSLTPGEAIVSLHPPTAPASAATVLRMQLGGANPAPEMIGLDQLPGRVNYFVGNDPSQWHTDVPSYARVLYRSVYAGVDQVYYGNRGRLEYDFVVAPGASPAAIRLGFAGAERMEINPQGDLILHIAGEQVLLRRPVLYQEAGGARQPVSGSFVLREAQQVGFEIGAYDPGRTLIIDPSIHYSTVFGDTRDDEGFAIAVDSEGAAYVTGFTTALAGDRDVFVTKLDSMGSIVYSTYLGGSRQDQGLGIAVDAHGRAVVTGFTRSPDFPITPSALQREFGGGSDAFVTQLDENGSGLLYSSFLGGPGDEEGRGIAVSTDASGQTLAYVTGITSSPIGFPIVNAAQPSYGGGNSDAFVTKVRINLVQPAYVYSTYLGGSGDENVGFQRESGGIAVDQDGTAYVTGATSSDRFATPNAYQQTRRGATDAFITIFASNGGLVYSTYLGGPGPDGGFPANEGNGIGVSDAWNVYVAGETSSVQFPTTPDAFQRQLGGSQAVNAFVTRLNPFLPPPQQLIYSTYLGGRAVDIAYGVSVTPFGAAYVAGSTTSDNFPTANPLQENPGGGMDAFVAKFNSGSSIAYSTYIGGPGDEVDRGVAWSYAQPETERLANRASFHNKVSGFCGRTGFQSFRPEARIGNPPYGRGPGPADAAIPCTEANTAGSQSEFSPTQVNVAQIGDCPCAITITGGVRMGSSVQLSWVDYCSDYTTGITIQWTTPDGGSGSSSIDCGSGGCTGTATLDGIPPAATFVLVADNSCCVTVESGPYFVP